MSRDPAPLCLYGYDFFGLNQDELDRIRSHRGAASLSAILEEALQHYLAERREGEDGERERRYPPRQEILLVLKGHVFGYQVDPDLFDEIYRLTPDPEERRTLHWGKIIREALRSLGRHLDDLAAPPISGSSPRRAPLWRAPAIADSMPREEARAAVRRWLRVD